MSVLIETSLGDLVVDLEIDSCPRVCENFLKLCKIKYYGLNAFFNVSKDFIAQTGDPTATGKGGESFASAYHSSLPDSEKRGRPAPPRYIAPEIKTSLKHTARGTVSMAVAPTGTSEKGGCGSQFFITLADNIEYLDGKHSVFGHVVEGFDVLDKLNDAYVDMEGRPLKDVRIRHIEILEDPFEDPIDLIEPPSPIRPPDDPSIKPRIGDDEELTTNLTEEEEEARKRAQEATASALTLEMIGDLPFANVRPPENILFVCKLNPVTTDEDLELIFSRFGRILSCEVIRDKKTGESLQYAFIEFDKQEDAEMVRQRKRADTMFCRADFVGLQAYFKMQNTLIDDRLPNRSARWVGPRDISQAAEPVLAVGVEEAVGVVAGTGPVADHIAEVMILVQRKGTLDTLHGAGTMTLCLTGMIDDGNQIDTAAADVIGIDGTVRTSRGTEGTEAEVGTSIEIPDGRKGGRTVDAHVPAVRMTREREIGIETGEIAIDDSFNDTYIGNEYREPIFDEDS
ncbi:hypothetical protein NliqN6_0654, partial [Naganishia liquefaciens]